MGRFTEVSYCPLMVIVEGYNESAEVALCDNNLFLQLYMLGCGEDAKGFANIKQLFTIGCLIIYLKNNVFKTFPKKQTHKLQNK